MIEMTKLRIFIIQYLGKNQTTIKYIHYFTLPQNKSCLSI